MNIIIRVKDFFLDLLFPRFCVGCGQEGQYLCSECKARISVNQKFYCVFCKTPTYFSMSCPHCRDNCALKAVWVAADYNNKILQELIHCLKYKYLEETATYLSAIIISFLEENKILEKFGVNANNSVIVPVPLHKKRYLSRGYNQSELLADNISEHFGIKKSNLLSRKINTVSQINLGKTERQKNVKNAFIFLDESGLNNKKVILIDDVVTTGSTLNECAQVLKNAGFLEIYGLVIAQRED